MDYYSLIFEESMEIIDEDNLTSQNVSFSNLEEAIAAEHVFSFNDRCIYRFANVKAYIYTNEKSSHNIPHVHIEIDKEKTFVISLIDHKLIKQNKNSRLFSEAERISSKNEQLFRMEWNNSSTLMKFIVDFEGNYKNEIYKANN